MEHCEVFDIITSPNGINVLQQRLFCATPQYHYLKTTTCKNSDEETNERTCSNHSQDTNCHSQNALESAVCHEANANAKEKIDVCSTGLRVYEGAQLLSAFVYEYANILLLMQCNSENYYEQEHEKLEQITSESTLVKQEEVDNLNFDHELMSINQNNSCDSEEKYTVNNKTINVVIELGCGCGLVGFTLIHWLHEARYGHWITQKQQYNPHVVLFTDGSLECLSLVRRSAKLLCNNKCVLLTEDEDISNYNNNSNSFCDTTINCNGDGESNVVCSKEFEDINNIINEKNRNAYSKTPCMTWPLQWTSVGVQEMEKELFQKRKLHHYQPSLIVGSDLMYYRVDVEQLIQTIKELLTLPHEPSEKVNMHVRENEKEEEEEEEEELLTHIPFVVLAHFMRIPNGRELLACTARRLGFGIVQIQPSCCLTTALVRERGWNGLEIVMLFDVNNAMKSKKWEIKETVNETRNVQNGINDNNCSNNNAQEFNSKQNSNKSYFEKPAMYNADESSRDVVMARALIARRKEILVQLHSERLRNNGVDSNNHNHCATHCYETNLNVQITRLHDAISAYPPKYKEEQQQLEERNKQLTSNTSLRSSELSDERYNAVFEEAENDLLKIDL